MNAEVGFIMLVSATEMLKKAKAGHYAVCQFNINNLEWTKAILQTAQECNSPVILGVSEEQKCMTGYKTVVGMVNGMLEEMDASSGCSASGSRQLRRMPEMCRSWFLIHNVDRCSLSNRRERSKNKRTG